MAVLPLEGVGGKEGTSRNPVAASVFSSTKLWMVLDTVSEQNQKYRTVSSINQQDPTTRGQLKAHPKQPVKLSWYLFKWRKLQMQPRFSERKIKQAHTEKKKAFWWNLHRNIGRSLHLWSAWCLHRRNPNEKSGGGGVFRCSLRGIITARQLSDALISTQRPMKYLWRKRTQRGSLKHNESQRSSSGAQTLRRNILASFTECVAAAAAVPWEKKKNIRRGVLGGTRSEHTNKQKTRTRAAVTQPLCWISAFLKEFLPSLPGSSRSQQDSSDCRSPGDWRHAQQRGFYF